MTTLSKKLAKELMYFHNYPHKRCTSENYNCAYDGESIGLKTKGCLIGRMLPKETRQQADIDKIGDIDSLIDYLEENTHLKAPKIICRENEGVLTAFQLLHDSNDSWDENGISEMGLARLESAFRNYPVLNREDFKEILA